ncbi:hypothetical protein V12B01_24994 [Vibrio splendidus 12B01]|nr:hypothetical protein V12B01_24994 [Vibrio splendidus 12B01]
MVYDKLIDKQADRKTRLPVIKNLMFIRRFMNELDIVLFYDRTLGDEIGNDFIEDLHHDKLKIQVFKENVSEQAYACYEWFLPPLIGVYIAKPYFEAFLTEMGKDHYKILKKKLGEIGCDVIKKKRIEPSFIGTEGKISADNPYTNTFSIVAESGEGFTFRLLLPKSDSDVDYQNIASAFLDFVHDYHIGTSTIIVEPNDIQSGLVFVSFNEEREEIEKVSVKK